MNCLQFEQQLDELKGAFDTDAAGAEGAHMTAEQFTVRRVMQVDRMFVGKADCDLTERGIFTRILAQCDIARIAPVDRSGV